VYIYITLFKVSSRTGDEDFLKIHTFRQVDHSFFFGDLKTWSVYSKGRGSRNFHTHVADIRPPEVKEEWSWLGKNHDKAEESSDQLVPQWFALARQ